MGLLPMEETMFAWVNKSILMIGMIVAGLGLLIAPMLVGPAYAPAELSSGIIGAVMLLVGIGLRYGSAEWWSSFALGIGTWSMVAPIALGFYHEGPAFWSHVAAGLASLLIGVGGHELMMTDGGSPNQRSRLFAKYR